MKEEAGRTVHTVTRRRGAVSSPTTSSPLVVHRDAKVDESNAQTHSPANLRTSERQRPSRTWSAPERRPGKPAISPYRIGRRFLSNAVRSRDTLTIFKNPLALCLPDWALALVCSSPCSYVSPPPPPPPRRKAVIPTRRRRRTRTRTRRASERRGDGDKLHGSCRSFG